MYQNFNLCTWFWKKSFSYYKFTDSKKNLLVQKKILRITQSVKQSMLTCWQTNVKDNVDGRKILMKNKLQSEWTWKLKKQMD